MKNFLQDGQVVPMTAPAGGVTSGSAYKIGGVIVLAMQDAAAGATFPAMVDGAALVPKQPGLAIVEGSVLYWDNTNKYFTTTVGSNTKCGFAYGGDALAGDATIKIRLYAQSA
jgi:predicted RecA/RadA family phage recombinase